MAVLHPRSHVGGEPGRVSVRGGVGQGGIILEGDGVSDVIVGEELGATTEGVDEKDPVLWDITYNAGDMTGVNVSPGPPTAVQ